MTPPVAKSRNPTGSKKGSRKVEVKPKGLKQLSVAERLFIAKLVRVDKQSAQSVAQKYSLPTSNVYRWASQLPQLEASNTSNLAAHEPQRKRKLRPLKHEALMKAKKEVQRQKRNAAQTSRRNARRAVNQTEKQLAQLKLS